MTDFDGLAGWPDARSTRARIGQPSWFDEAKHLACLDHLPLVNIYGHLTWLGRTHAKHVRTLGSSLVAEVTLPLFRILESFWTDHTHGTLFVSVILSLFLKSLEELSEQFYVERRKEERKDCGCLSRMAFFYISSFALIPRSLFFEQVYKFISLCPFAFSPGVLCLMIGWYWYRPSSSSIHCFAVVVVGHPLANGNGVAFTYTYTYLMFSHHGLRLELDHGVDVCDIHERKWNEVSEEVACLGEEALNHCCFPLTCTN